MSKAAENPTRRNIRLSLGADAEAELDWHREMLCVRCASGKVTLRMLLEQGIVGDYAARSGSLALATWMVVEVRCSPEDAMELVEAIGPRVMSDFVFTEQ
ncbi:hypothetical protein ACMX25_38685 [Caballeronia sp. 15715]|uniref:hypothetical protein n=1 Tax=Caballeronia sp. 15715 TaxID=3391030 RepID=UPI000BCF243B|nr:hypothetical protein SAMN05414139_02335 [Burkholderia sp. D7]